jgi:outer membrane protein insertion porin family
LLRDRRDSPFDPTSGSFTTLDMSVVARTLGGSENFLRFFGEHQRLYKVTPLPGAVFALDTRLGLAWPYGRSFALPISERFFAGGSTTLRGFGFEQAGPRDPDPDRPGQTRPQGGNALAILNAELRFPILSALRLGGAVFYDGGNIFARVSDFSFRDFAHTLGFGLRIRTPIGPLRLDFGVLVGRKPGVPRTQLHVTFGNPF